MGFSLKKFKSPAKKYSPFSDKFNAKYSTGIKIGAALSGIGGLGAMLDPDVTGARGSAKMLGRSVDQVKDKNMLAATEEADRQKAEAAAAAAAAEKPFDEAKESQRKALLRKGRRASILTSSQGASDPLGIPG